MTKFLLSTIAEDKTLISNKGISFWSLLELYLCQDHSYFIAAIIYFLAYGETFGYTPGVLLKATCSLMNVLRY